MEKFFNKFGHFPKLKITLEEIVPEEHTELSIKERAVYISYVKKITYIELDNKLSPHRQKALNGLLEPKDFRELNDLLEFVSSRTKYDAYLISADQESSKFHAYAEVKTHAKTGVEMEALVAASVSALTIYDMCKAIDKSMTITDLFLMEKRGGKSGTFKRKGA